MWIETSNRIYGRTNNPWDLHRTCGGSSGGEGALVSSCASVWGIGTDIGGSIRIPSAWCGLFGHKPSPGYVTRKGVAPEKGRPLKETIGVVGPIAKTADDLLAMMKIISDDPNKLRLNEEVDVTKLRYFFCDNEGASFISSGNAEVRKQVHRVVDFVERDLSGTVAPLSNSDQISRNQDFWLAYLANNGFPDVKDFFVSPETSWQPTMEMFYHASGHSDRTIYAIVVSILDDIYRKNKPKCEQDYRDLLKFKQHLNELLGDDGVLILPSSLTAAPFHHGTLCNPGLYLGLSGIINVMHLPSTVIPMGLSSKGIPLSVQIVSNHANDRLTIAVAKELERKFGGFKPPCDVKEDSHHPEPL